MKRIIKRIIIYILLIIILTSLGIIGLKNQPSDKIEESILNKEYFRYNTNKGTHDKIKISEKTIEYEGDKINLKNCKNYKYTEATGIIKFDCNKEIRLITYNKENEAIIINTNEENLYFYLDKEKSLLSEFQRRYQMTLDSYRIEGEEKLKQIEIDNNKLKELSEKEEKSYIYIKSKNCKNECSLYNKEFMNFTNSNNKYYLNGLNITSTDITELSQKYPNIPITLDTFEQTSPIVLIINNKSLQIIKIKGNGFDYSSYRNYAETMEGQNE